MAEGQPYTINGLPLKTVHQLLRRTALDYLDQDIGPLMRDAMANWMMESFKQQLFGFDSEAAFEQSAFAKKLKQDLAILRPVFAFAALSAKYHTEPAFDAYFALDMTGLLPEEDIIKKQWRDIHEEVADYIRNGNGHENFDKNLNAYTNENGKGFVGQVYIPDEVICHGDFVEPILKSLSLYAQKGQVCTQQRYLELQPGFVKIYFMSFNEPLKKVRKRVPDARIVRCNITLDRKWLNLDLNAELRKSGFQNAVERQKHYKKLRARIRRGLKPQILLRRRP
tara:strand:+ start:7316 stop:8158 length:843 start_codon:yes stop_codon:yes gene_type:complete